MTTKLTMWFFIFYFSSVLYSVLKAFETQNIKLSSEISYLKNVSQHKITKKNEITTCENSHRLSVFSNYLKVSKYNPLREQLLKEFLCIKFFQHYDVISYMAIEEFRLSFSFKIMKNNYEEKVNKVKKHGVDICDLESVANQNTDKIVSICPWYWLIIRREDRFPFQLPIAKCNCVNCQAKTPFDSEKYKRSRCNPNYSLLPVLIREPIEIGSDEEIWVFNLEEVPFSCSCNIKINPY
jgi:hypothetical protein